MTIGSEMHDNLRTIMDASGDLLDHVRRETTKLDIVMSALYEQAHDDVNDPEIPGMLQDAASHAKQAQASLLAFRDYLSEIAREML